MESRGEIEGGGKSRGWSDPRYTSTYPEEVMGGLRSRTRTDAWKKVRQRVGGFRVRSRSISREEDGGLQDPEGGGGIRLSMKKVSFESSVYIWGKPFKLEARFPEWARKTCSENEAAFRFPVSRAEEFLPRSRGTFEQIKLKEIIAVAPKINTPSINVMQKIGMQKIKNFKHPLLVDFPELETCVLYAIK